MFVNKATQECYDTDAANWEDRALRNVYGRSLYARHFDIVRPFCSGGDVLEVGCGPGILMDRLKDHCGSITGVDIAPEMVNEAQNRGLTAIVASGEDLPFCSMRFDLVFSVLVLAHVQSVSACLREIARVLRPGGKFAVEFYNRWSLKPYRTDVYEKHHSYKEALSLFPHQLQVEELYGTFVFTPCAMVLEVPVIGEIILKLERLATETILKRLSRHLIFTGVKTVDGDTQRSGR